MVWRTRVLDIRKHARVWSTYLMLVVRLIVLWLTSDWWGLTYLEWVGIGIVLFAIGCAEIVTAYSWYIRGK